MLTNRIKNRINFLISIQDHWDYGHGQKVPTSVINRIEKFVIEVFNIIKKEDIFLFALPEGGISVEWFNDKKSFSIYLFDKNSSLVIFNEETAKTEACVENIECGNEIDELLKFLKS